MLAVKRQRGQKGTTKICGWGLEKKKHNSSQRVAFLYSSMIPENFPFSSLLRSFSFFCVLKLVFVMLRISCFWFVLCLFFFCCCCCFNHFIYTLNLIEKKIWIKLEHWFCRNLRYLSRYGFENICWINHSARNPSSNQNSWSQYSHVTPRHVTPHEND